MPRRDDSTDQRSPLSVATLLPEETAEERRRLERKRAAGQTPRLCRNGKVMNVANIGRHRNRPTRRPASEACEVHLTNLLLRWWNDRRPDATEDDVARALRRMAAKVGLARWAT